MIKKFLVIAEKPAIYRFLLDNLSNYIDEVNRIENVASCYFLLAHTPNHTTKVGELEWCDYVRNDFERNS